MAVTDPHGLERFVAAQDDGGTYEQALAELRRGRKSSHWMWFVFPQLAGLGRSATAQRFSIASLAEARAYAAHPVLGPRLVACAEVVVHTEGRTAQQVLGDTDAMKLRSSATLFARAVPEEPVWQAVLDHWYAGEPDPATDALLDA